MDDEPQFFPMWSLTSDDADKVPGWLPLVLLLSSALAAAAVVTVAVVTLSIGSAPLTVFAVTFLVAFAVGRLIA
jgi:hypothetical protein